MNSVSERRNLPQTNYRLRRNSVYILVVNCDVRLNRMDLKYSNQISQNETVHLNAQPAIFVF